MIAQEGSACTSPITRVFLILLLLVGVANTYAQSSEEMLHFSAATEAKKAGQFERAIQLYQEELNQLDTLVDLAAVARGYKECARIYEAIGKYAVSIQNYEKALHFYEKLEDLDGQVEVLNSFGYFYEIQHDHARSEDYYLRALALAKESGNERMIAQTHTALGSLLSNFLGRSEGLLFLDSAIESSLKRNDVEGLSIAYNEKARAYCNIGDFIRGIDMYQLSLAIDVKAGNQTGQVISQNNIAAAFLFTEQPDSSIAYASSALTMSQELGLLDDQRLSARILSYGYKALNDIDNAFLYFEQYVDLSDSVFIQQNLDEVRKVQAQYEADLKDREIESLNQEKQLSTLAQQTLSLQAEKQQRWIIIMIIGFLLLIVTALSLFIRFKTRQSNLLLKTQLEGSEQKRKVEEELRVSQVKAIKAQMNPHFMFNVLSSVQGSLVNKDTDKAMQQLGNFGELMRKILQSSEAHWVSLEEELHLLQHYIELEALRFEGGISYSAQVQLPEDEEGQTLEADEVMIPSLLIQPLLENAVKHGFRNHSKDHQLKLTIAAQDNTLLSIAVEDNGIGRLASSNNRSTRRSGVSLGLRGVKQRLESVHQLQNTSGQLVVDDLQDRESREAQGTRIQFSVPFVREDQVHRQKELIV